ncbi:hypothetical protein NECAME_01912 [Necator americanus]|uniref:Uncharacterized protein n=1 Tax=Necator americanus TaxID=51031 RepID=W2TNN7_NECAM|nr:hypothetical protein NECAME_01912 [Necator americanus]ETN82627.1 hypothetical protein NECAME_01912 [Necator americanus]
MTSSTMEITLPCLPDRRKQFEHHPRLCPRNQASKETDYTQLPYIYAHLFIAHVLHYFLLVH